MKRFAFSALINIVMPLGMIFGMKPVVISGAATQNFKSDINSERPIIIGLKSRHPAIDLAGAELAKYMGMMADNSDAATVANNPASIHFTAGTDELQVQLELGLLTDFGLTVDGVDDPTLDDAIYIDVRDSRGVIAGSNPRSVLFAVYRFLEASGCRWIRPGPGGDYVPLQRVDNLLVQQKDKAAYRFRGHNNSGAYSIDYIISKIEWGAKMGLNTYFNEFLIPKKFFQSWYNRDYLSLKEPSPRTDTEIIAYHDLLNKEVKRRGLLLHAAGHGWNAKFFGNPEVECDHWGNIVVPGDQTEYLSLVGGERIKGGPTTTELCYGNPQVRQRLVHLVADYAETNQEVDYLHFWLSDRMGKVCECELCHHTRISDFYVMILNEIDKELSRRNISTRIVFLIYNDTLWPPEKEKLSNQDRFVLMFAPGSRFYDEPYEMPGDDLVLPAYQLNQNTRPRDNKLNVLFLQEWQKVFQGPGFAYDYHMWYFHLYDQGYYGYLDLLATDIQRLTHLNLDGFVSCQMQRNFYPHGLPHHTHACLLWNPERDVDDLARYYFDGAFGKEGALAYEYMKTLSDLFSPNYFYLATGIRVTRDMDIPLGKEESREANKKLLMVEDAVQRFQPVIERNLRIKDPLHQLSWKYLSVHSGMVILMAEAFLAKNEGRYDDEKTAWNALREYIIKNEQITEDVFDVFSFQRIFPALQ